MGQNDTSQQGPQPGFDQPVKPKNGKVKLKCVGEGSAPNLSWRMKSDQPGSQGESGEVVECSRRDDGPVIQFTIKIQQPQGVVFDRDRPITVVPDDGSIGDIRADGDTLTFTDTNHGEVEMKYTLHFANANPFDPIIRNRT